MRSPNLSPTVRRRRETGQTPTSRRLKGERPDTRHRLSAIDAKLGDSSLTVTLMAAPRPPFIAALAQR
jgi:hypothetical protein